MSTCFGCERNKMPRKANVDPIGTTWVLVLILLIMPMLDRFMLGKPLPARHGGEYVFFCKLR